MTNARPANSDQAIRFKRIDFANFKALQRCTIHLRGMNVLVGANNSGKSTVVGALRVLAAGVRTAATQRPILTTRPDGRSDYAWSVPFSEIPVSLENARTDFRDDTATVKFTLSNDTHLTLCFPVDGGCLLFAEGRAGGVKTAGEFKKQFPIRVGVVPVLGPVEDEEELVEQGTVMRNLVTHRAARNFRSYWRYFPERFEDFATLVRETWEGMEVQAPEVVPRAPKARVTMMCKEDRYDRELYWLGFGFQIWCQLLTHIVRNRDATILALDEPETYLHPDVQRKLVHVLRDTGASIVLATHSSEIVSEVEPDDLVLLDRKRRTARRLDEVDDVQRVLDSIGSLQNMTLTRIAKTQRLLFVEGQDFSVLGPLAGKLGLDALSRGEGLTVVQSEGFGAWQKVDGLAWGIKQALGKPIAVGIVLDRDHRSDETVADIIARLEKNLGLVHVHSRKELENYLLEEGPLRRSLQLEGRRRGLETGDAVALFMEATEALHDELVDHYVVERKLERMRGGRAEATVLRELRDEFRTRWVTFEGRAQVIAGKRAFHVYAGHLQERFGVSLSIKRVLNAIRGEEISPEMCALLRRLEDFRRARPE